MFTNETIKTLMEFMWDRTWPYFYREMFIPFVWLNLLPVVLLPLTLSIIDHTDDTMLTTLLDIFHILTLTVLTFGNVRSLLYEIKEFRNKEDYLRDPINYFQLSLIISTTFVTITAYQVEYWRFMQWITAEDI